MFKLNYATIIDPLLRDIRLYTPQFSGMQSGDKVLDVCCGTGEQMFQYSRRGIITTGIDLSPSMLRLAAMNKTSFHPNKSSVLLANATVLPFKDSCFDYASVSFGLHDKEGEA